ncbi:MAG TPA: MFS transporter, partial [Bacillales bacterium]
MQKRSVANLRAFQFFFHSAATIIISFLPLYFKNEGLTGTEIGWLLAIGPFVSLLVQPVSGYMSDKYQTVKRVLIVCLIGLILSSTVLFQMNSFAAFMLACAVFFCFMSPIGALGDSLAQKTADQKKIPFGSIRTWGSIGFSTTALITGQVLSVIGVGNIIFPYLFYAGAAFLLSFFISDVKVSQQPVKFAEAGRLLKNHKLVLFLFFMMFITVTHRANDSFIAIYITQLGGDESLVGVAWFAGVASEAAMFALSTLWFRRFHELTFMFVAGFLYGTRWLIYSFIN